MRTYEDLCKSLTNQSPTTDQIADIELLRERAKFLGGAIIDFVPVGREQSLALTKLEDCVMWAVKGIVVNKRDEEASK